MWKIKHAVDRMTTCSATRQANMREYMYYSPREAPASQGPPVEM